MQEEPIVSHTPLGDLIILTKEFLQKNYINLSWKKISDLTSQEKQMLGQRIRPSIPEKFNFDIGVNITKNEVNFSDDFVNGLYQSEQHHIIWEDFKKGGTDEITSTQ